MFMPLIEGGEEGRGSAGRRSVAGWRGGGAAGGGPK